ncbi:MAG: hypothetical protein DHS80DRAFT_23286 [Piptocephalis tieghemiana]|nr:MAG: hypothetical protein DHS80DRAFT_23286 [Piptocephalis tieghemiana]
MPDPAGKRKETTLCLLQDRGLLGMRGVTGSVAWDSSIALARLMYAQPDFLPKEVRPQGKRVVELGSGCGLIGLTCAALGARQVVCTDRADMLAHLERNIRANEDMLGSRPTSLTIPLPGKASAGRRERKARRRGKVGEEAEDPPSERQGEGTILVSELEWGQGLGREGGRTRGDPLTRLLTGEEGPPDILIASDCVYNECVTPLLVSTMVELSGPGTMLLVAQELRSDVVHLAFLEALMESFILDRVYPAAPHATMMEGDEGRGVEEGRQRIIPDVSLDVPVVIYVGRLRGESSKGEGERVDGEQSVS